MRRSLTLVASSCSGADVEPPSRRPGQARSRPRAMATFVLDVSNQSFELPEVDIRVEIDQRGRGGAPPAGSSRNAGDPPSPVTLHVRFGGRDLDLYVDTYNFDRPYHGRLTRGRIPAEIVYRAAKVKTR
jgi:hypothetical protein